MSSLVVIRTSSGGASRRGEAGVALSTIAILEIKTSKSLSLVGFIGYIGTSTGQAPSIP
jgi:hypothetical protein